MGGGKLKNKNAFTLIELLAIIVILAIIAVITVPIILNIIENSRRGAATDSAYGFKDAVNKYYVTELSGNHELTLQGLYTVSTGGVLNGSGIDGIAIPVSGDKPSAGELHYTNNTLQGGCLVIGDYQVIFDGGSVSSTTKGDCSEYVYSDGSIPSCPGCKFIYTKSKLRIETTEMQSLNTTDDYRDLIGSHPYFLGLIESDDPTKEGKIGRAFACGIENGTPFCLEGYDTSKWSDDYNVGVINTIFPGCNASASDSPALCNGSSVNGDAYDDGYVDVYDDYGSCNVYDSGDLYCNE